jgi:hypothetical protein
MRRGVVAAAAAIIFFGCGVYKAFTTLLQWLLQGAWSRAF